MAPSRASVTTASTLPDWLTLRTPSRGVTLASLASSSTQACTLSALSGRAAEHPVGGGDAHPGGLELPGGLVRRPRRRRPDTVRATRALAWSATSSAAAVVTTGTASTNFTVAVAEVRSRAASATTSWKLSGAMVWPTTAGVTTKDFLSAASFTLASRPALSAWPTRPATTVAVLGGVGVDHGVDAALGDERLRVRRPGLVGDEHRVDGGVDVDRVAELGQGRGAGGVAGVDGDGDVGGAVAHGRGHLVAGHPGHRGAADACCRAAPGPGSGSRRPFRRLRGRAGSPRRR